MDLTALVTILAENIEPLIADLQLREKIAPLGLRRAERLPVLAAIQMALSRPVLLITDRADHAMNLFDELALWAPHVSRLLFPEPNPLFYEKSPWGDNTRRDRLTAFAALASYHIPGVGRQEKSPIIIAPARAVMTRTIPRREFLKATHNLKQGQKIQPVELARTCVLLGYERVNTVIQPGHFARRGGLLDLWPSAEKQPVRIEFFGDEIDTLRLFDPFSQRTIKTGIGETLARILVTPAREFILPSEFLVESQEEEIHEFHIPLLHTMPASLLDYLPPQALVLVDDMQALQETIAETEEQAMNLRKEYTQDGNLSENFPIPYLPWNEIIDSLQSHQVVELGPHASQDQDEQSSATPSAMFSPGPRFGGRLKVFIDHLSERLLEGDTLVVVSRQKSRLEELWKEAGFLLSADPENKFGQLANEFAPVSFIHGSLAEGWTFNPPDGAAIHLFSDGEMFGWRRPEFRQRRRIIAEDPESAYGDLQAGDFVVHIDHGIGIFVGLVHRAIDGNEREYLCVEYADEAQLFVPVYQADRLTRYVGPDNRTPSLSRLGSAEWHSVKAHVKEAVQEVAEDLLVLYAERSVVTGYAFQSDTLWQGEMEASFPYIETEDQVRVLAEVKQDMQNPRPMDRLICGDVGYGKTEVALRAAFKAVMDGKQVAVLVPTTVLAQQHYETFQQRLATFPVVVEMLSRFRTPQQQREIVQRLAKGGVDIVIGTHRLLSNDILFKDLGLLVIDEEQRFGVTHKETLKKMRTEVDVLTLTATPIPRTLYMALTGVRDISTINTPPEERLPIINHLGPYSPELIRRAVLRELERGGQVFFVHNRVQTIQGMHSHLEKLVPEARIAVAHGQMPESELSERMRQFTNGEVDILLTTSIIESGLDIPNANTLIVDRADTFGLAQLYQLRGRVGRGAQRAYAYFFRHKRKSPTSEGRQRLETIAENTQLGAGFSIAMRDLEIRGTGDILGTRQSGHMAAVGFHLYARMLSEVVQRLRKTSDLLLLPVSPAVIRETQLPVTIDLPLTVSIPTGYVPEKNMRLRLYRRLAEVRTLGEVNALEEEFNDRFGPPPEGARNLLYQLKVKIMAEGAGLTSIHAENGQLVLKYPDGTRLTDLPDLGSHARSGKTAIWLSILNYSNWPELLEEILTRLASSQPLYSYDTFTVWNPGLQADH